jgi:hypothetical protein
MLNLSDAQKKVIGIASFSVALLALFNAWAFYKNNIWQPSIEVVDVDYKKGIANLIINGKPFVLKGDSNYLIGYDWGIKFGYTYIGTKRNYDRIEILKRNMVHKVLKSADEKHGSFTGNEKTFWDDVFLGDKANLSAVKA